MMMHTHKVLVVEDNECIREVVRMCLEREGIGVVEANDGSEAIEIISNLQYTNPDVCAILLDVMLPKVDGLSVLAYLRGLGRPVPVIAMSADPGLLTAAMQGAADAAIEKPFNVHEMVSLVTSRCASQQSPLVGVPLPARSLAERSPIPFV
jgi:CheY-like chemotaxis protein